jgi:hypothetical protein
MVTDPSEKTVKEPGPGAPDRVMLLADPALQTSTAGLHRRATAEATLT